MRHAMGRFTFGLLAILACSPLHAAFLPLDDVQIQAAEPETSDIVSQSRLYCAALAVYFEGGSTAETEDGQRHIASVVAERAKANLRKWGGSDLCDVVFYRRNGVCQFSFACLPQARRTPRENSRWQQAMAIAKEELDGASGVQERNIRYYMNPALTSDRNACRFRKEFVPVIEAGRHQFFREPTEAEREELVKSDPAECKRYEAALEAKRRAAKAAAEKKKRMAAAHARKKTKKLRYARR
jgi:hypothetical protein